MNGLIKKSPKVVKLVYTEESNWKTKSIFPRLCYIAIMILDVITDSGNLGDFYSNCRGFSHGFLK